MSNQNPAADATLYCYMLHNGGGAVESRLVRYKDPDGPDCKEVWVNPGITVVIKAYPGDILVGSAMIISKEEYKPGQLITELPESLPGDGSAVD
jgi:hypothetical protein